MLSNLRVGSKIILLVLILVSVAVILESINSQYISRKVIEKNYSERLKNVSNIQNIIIDKHLRNVEELLTHITSSNDFLKAFQYLDKNSNNTSDSARASSKKIRQYLSNEIFSQQAHKLQSHDILLLNDAGEIIFKNSNTNLHREVFHNADNQIVDIHTHLFYVNKPVRESNTFYSYYTIPIFDNSGVIGCLLLKNKLQSLIDELFIQSMTGIDSYQIQTFIRIKDEIYEVSKSDMPDNIEYNEKTLSTPYELTLCNDPQKQEGSFISTSPQGSKILLYHNLQKNLHLGYVSSVSYDEITLSLGVSNIHTWLIAFIIIALSLGLSIYFARIITHPIEKLQNILRLISNGILPRKLYSPLKDEIGEMVQTVNKIITSLKNTASFAHHIGSGDFNTEFKPSSNKDILGIALVSMRENLLQAELRDKMRNWIVTGVAEMGEILRHSTTIETLGDDILTFLCNKINAAQAIMYITKEEQNEEKYLTVISSYAFHKKKYVKHTIRFAQGLAGQAAIEKNNIIRTEIPEDYFHITSGILGDKKPNCILLIPLITNDNVFGVLEFAGFNKFTENQITFLNEISEMIARTIFNMQVNEQTKMLLTNAQQMSLELEKQKAELQKKAEEMAENQKIIEETNHKLEEQILNVSNAQKRTQSLLENSSEVIIIYNKDGIIQYVSPSVYHILEYKETELIGKNDIHLIAEKDQEKVSKFHENLLNNSKETAVIKFQYYKKTGDKIWLEATGKNMLKDSAINGIVFNTRDITERIKAEEEERKRGQMQALSENSTDLILRLDNKGNCFYINPTISKLSNCSPSDIIGKNLNETTIEKEVINDWMDIVKKVFLQKQAVTTEITLHTHSGIKTMLLNGIPEFNLNKEVETTLIVSHDITEQKNTETEIKNTNQKINDSINYAEIIQETILPNNEKIKNTFQDSFIFFKPKDVVSGDFPWFYQKDDYAYIAAIDCTGHGVPGAMISIVGYFLLNNILSKNTLPNAGELLNELDFLVTSTFNQNEESSKIKDGMDVALCRINLKTKQLDFAGANRPLYLVSNEGKLTEIKGNKFPIGGGLAYANKTPFTNNEVQLQEKDSVYFFSDGFPDQFGGDAKTKFGPARIKSMLIENYHLPLKEMSNLVVNSFETWKESTHQTDDVLLIGIRF